jgi:predicted DNA-binding antitoxin AbrB/MazE fold protein
MTQPIRAVYDHGSLRLLDDVQLAEGQEVHLVILSERDRARIALGDLLVEMPEPPGAAEIDEAALLEEVAEALRGAPPLSEAIIAERRESL